MSHCPAQAKEHPVPVVVLDKPQPGQVRLVCIHRNDGGSYGSLALSARLEIQPGKVVSNPAATLSQSNNCQLHLFLPI
jgi:hypothetical protein